MYDLRAFGSSTRVAPHQGFGEKEIGVNSISYRVLLVDDYEPWRRFVRSILQTQPGFKVAGEADCGTEAIQKATELKPDLMVLDIGLPDFDGIEVSRRIGHSVPGMKILFMSQNNDADVVRAALSNGVCGYLLKVDSGIELLPAIETIRRGEKFVSKGARLKLSQ